MCGWGGAVFCCFTGCVCSEGAGAVLTRRCVVGAIGAAAHGQGAHDPQPAGEPALSCIACNVRNWACASTDLGLACPDCGMCKCGFGAQGAEAWCVGGQYSDRLLTSPTALAGILTIMHSCLDFKGIILGKYHYLMFMLSTAMQPRMLVTLGPAPLLPFPPQDQTRAHLLCGTSEAGGSAVGTDEKGGVCCHR